MKSVIIFAYAIIVSYGTFAQSNKYSKEINEQVWKPFIRSFSSGDDDGFRSVHSKDVIRVT